MIRRSKYTTSLQFDFHDKTIDLLSLAIQNRYFVNCVEIVHFKNVSHVISEHMTLSLLQIVAAPR